MTEENPTARWVHDHADEVRAWPAVATRPATGCAVEACSRDWFAAGLCRPHYKRATRAARAEEKGKH